MSLNSYTDLQETCNALYVRCDKWVRFRTAVTVQLKNQFMYNLSLRGYLGVMEVDHENGTIELRVCLEVIIIFPSSAHLVLWKRYKQTIKYTINWKICNAMSLRVRRTLRR